MNTLQPPALAGSSQVEPAAAGVAPLDDLFAVLAAEDTVYEQLQQVAQERQAAIAAADLAGLSELVGRERPLLSRMRKLEVARLQALLPWAACLGTNPEQITITRLCSLVDAASAAALLAAKARMLTRAKALADANRRNADVLQPCLDSVNASLQHLLQAVQLDPRYASNGNRLDQGAAPRLTDLRA